MLKLKIKCSVFIRNTFVLSGWLLVPAGYWATFCTVLFSNLISFFDFSIQIRKRSTKTSSTSSTVADLNTTLRPTVTEYNSTNSLGKYLKLRDAILHQGEEDANYLWDSNSIYPIASITLNPGGGGGGKSGYERVGDVHRKFSIKPLKETNWGMAQAFCDPKKRPCWNTDNRHIFVFFRVQPLTQYM